MIHGGLSGKMWGEEVPPVFFRPDDDCGDPLGEINFDGKEHGLLNIGGTAVKAKVLIYEKCVRVQTWMPDGTPLSVDPPTKVPNNTPAPEAPGAPAHDHLQITTRGHTFNTRIYDLGIDAWPTSKTAQGVWIDSAAGYFKFIEVDGDCQWKFVQLGRVKLTAQDANGKDVAVTWIPKGGGFGVDSPGGALFGGAPNNPEYPTSGPVETGASNPNTTFLVDFPTFKDYGTTKADLKRLYDSDIRLVQLDWEFHTWIICDGVPLGYWKWFFAQRFGITPDGERANERINPFGSPSDPSFGIADASNTSELNGLTLPR